MYVYLLAEGTQNLRSLVVNRIYSKTSGTERKMDKEWEPVKVALTGE